MNPSLRSILLLLPLVPGLAVVVASAVFVGLTLLENPTDGQVVRWVFWLLTGFVATLFIEQLASRALIRSESLPTTDSTSTLLGYADIIRAGLTEQDMGKQRTEKARSRTASASRSVFNLGIAFSNMWGKENLQFWEEVLAKCTVRMMILDPTWLTNSPETLELLAEHLDRNPTILLAQINESLANMGTVRMNLPESRRSRLHVRTYRGLPAITITLLDEDTPSAQLIIELLPYKCGFRNRPHMVVRPMPGGWYDTLRRLAEDRWHNGEDAFASSG